MPVNYLLNCIHNGIEGGAGPHGAGCHLGVRAVIAPDIRRRTLRVVQLLNNLLLIVRQLSRNIGETAWSSGSLVWLASASAQYRAR